VRFPDAVGLTFCVPNNDEENRVRAISQFFEEARKRLAPYNVFLAADIFGYVCWNPERYLHWPEAGSACTAGGLYLADVVSIRFSIRDPGLPHTPSPVA